MGKVKIQMKRYIKSNATSTTSDVRTYQNRRNENKFIETKKYKDGHSVARQYMKWETPEGTVKNYTVAKDANRGRWYRTRQNTRDMMLDDYDEVVVDETVESATELDDRFSFSFDDIEPEFWLKTTTEPAKIYLEDEYVIGNGAGMAYDVEIAVPYKDAHWQIMSDIEDSLERHMDETLDGSDYTFSIHNVSKYGSYPNFASVPEEVLENSVFYKAIIDVVPFENVDMYDEYRIGAFDDEIEDVPFR